MDRRTPLEEFWCKDEQALAKQLCARKSSMHTKMDFGRICSTWYCGSPCASSGDSTAARLNRYFARRFFFAQDSDKEQEQLAKALEACAKKGKVLFILDGLDEIVADTEGDDRMDFRLLLTTLISQQHVVVTARPSGSDGELLQQIDMELETVGFSQQNVDDFLVKVLETEAARALQDFIGSTPLIQGLVNIPALLDVICLSWDSLPGDGQTITMTGLYQLMVRKLWCKDALRLKKTDNGEVLVERHIHEYEDEWIDNLMATEVLHLGYLAFKGMNNNHQIEFDERDMLSAFWDLKDDAMDKQRLSPPRLVDEMKQTSFLHTADADLSRDGGSRPAWHFLHLTFQEYFAATWIVRHFHSKQPRSTAGMMTMDQMTAYVHQHKYNPQLEIVWTMVAGLLEGEPLSDFFGLLQGAPRDLIWGRHQQILASCLNEARTRLDSKVVEGLDEELMNWLRFEMQTCQQDEHSRSMLGSQLSFPEEWKPTLLNSLAARSAVLDSTIHFPIAAPKDGDRGVASSSAWTLAEQSTLPESAIHSLITALKDDDEGVRSSAASALGRQSSLPESAIQSLIAALKDENEVVRSSAASALGDQSTLPESSIQSLIAALKDENEDVRSSAASALGGQSSLSESAIQSLICALMDEDEGVRHSVS